MRERLKGSKKESNDSYDDRKKSYDVVKLLIKTLKMDKTKRYGFD